MNTEFHHSDSEVAAMLDTEEKGLLKTIFNSAKIVYTPDYPDAHDWRVHGVKVSIQKWVVSITACPESGDTNEYITLESFTADEEYSWSLYHVIAKLKRKKDELAARQSSIETENFEGGGANIKSEDPESGGANSKAESADDGGVNIKTEDAGDGGVDIKAEPFESDKATIKAEPTS